MSIRCRDSQRCVGDRACAIIDRPSRRHLRLRGRKRIDVEIIACTIHIRSSNETTFEISSRSRSSRKERVPNRSIVSTKDGHVDGRPATDKRSSDFAYACVRQERGRRARDHIGIYKSAISCSTFGHLLYEHSSLVNYISKSCTTLSQLTRRLSLIALETRSTALYYWTPLKFCRSWSCLLRPLRRTRGLFYRRWKWQPLKVNIESDKEIGLMFTRYQTLPVLDGNEIIRASNRRSLPTIVRQRRDYSTGDRRCLFIIDIIDTLLLLIIDIISIINNK